MPKFRKISNGSERYIFLSYIGQSDGSKKPNWDIKAIAN